MSVEKDIEHRRFSVTLQPTQLFECMKTCIRNGELSDEKLLTLFRITADQLNRSDGFHNVTMWEYIKGRTENWFVHARKNKIHYKNRKWAYQPKEQFERGG